MILITGGVGFVGRHLLDALHRRNPETAIRILDTAPAAGRLPSGVEVMQGRIEDATAAAAAVRGVDTVVHLAAKVRPDSNDVDDLVVANVSGTKTIYGAATRAGARLFLHISTAGVYGLHSQKLSSEADQLRPVTPYQRTKRDAEAVLRRSEPNGTTVNILRPTGIYGPGSLLEIPAYRKVRRQTWSLELEGGVIVHPIDVSDVVGAILALIDQPAAHGTVFNVGGEQPILVQELNAMIASLLNVRRRRIIAPAIVTGPLVTIGSPIVTRLSRGDVLVASATGRFLSVAVDDRLFRTHFPGVPVRPLEEGLRDHLDWALSQKLL